MPTELLCKETPTRGHKTVSGKSRRTQMGASLLLENRHLSVTPLTESLRQRAVAYERGVRFWCLWPTERHHAAVGRESMTVRRVLDKRVDYIKRVWHINPLTHSYTTLKRFTTCLQMLSAPSSLSYGDIEFSTLRCKRFPTNKK